MRALTACVQGIGWWTPDWPDWRTAAAAMRGEAVAPAAARPHTPLLAANERRRAPESVLMALQVAAQACETAGADPAGVASVFASAHGDLAIVDALCRTLADDPLALSPMRFHHSVHNAASGYWAIGARNPQASTAVAAGDRSFAAGLLEALVQCAADAEPRLLVGTDTEACGPLRSVNRSRGRLAVALLLAPGAGPGRGLTATLQPRAAALPALRSAAAAAVCDNAIADALPLFEALCDRSSTNLVLPLGERLALALTLGPA